MMGSESESVSQYEIHGTQKSYWRSASWSARSTIPSPRNYENLPLTPRTQQNMKGRACLPPLQPLSVARRSFDEWPKASSDDTCDWAHPPTPGSEKELQKLDRGSNLNICTSNGNLENLESSDVRKERISSFDKECSKVANHIYLGGDIVAKNREILRQNGITHVLNCVGFVCPEYFKSDLVYKTLWLQDSPSEDITSILYDVFDYFEDVREQGGRVLVHCCQGVSRSTSLVIAYLMWREGQSFDDAFQYVKSARRITDPNMGFACQLLQCQKRVHAVPLSPSSIVRMYRMAPHSPYDPLHLVPKMLSEPSVSALDSRGAFVVVIPSAIYVWIGKNCEFVMARDAKAAAFQVVRYEKAEGPVVAVKEGEEPSAFWNAILGNLVSSGKSDTRKNIVVEPVGFENKVPIGRRKVSAYDVDFENFHQAIKGGFIPLFPLWGVGSRTHLPSKENTWSLLRRKFAPENAKDWVSSPSMGAGDVKDTCGSLNKTHYISSDKPPLPPITSSSASSSLSAMHVPQSSEHHLPSRGTSRTIAQRRGNISPSLSLSALPSDSVAVVSNSCCPPVSSSLCNILIDSDTSCRQMSEENNHCPIENGVCSLKYQKLAYGGSPEGHPRVHFKDSQEIHDSISICEDSRDSECSSDMF